MTWCFARGAHADMADTSYGLGLTYASPKEARAELRLSYGLNELFAVRAAAGLGVSDEATRALFTGGLVYAYDVVTWVPEIGAYGGVSVGDGFHHGRLLALAGVRRYLSRTTSVSLSAGAEYDWGALGGNRLHALIDLGLWL